MRGGSVDVVSADGDAAAGGALELQGGWAAGSGRGGGVSVLSGGSASGQPLRTVQVGGPLGAYLPASLFDTLVDYEAFAAIGGMLGHGGVVAFDDRVNMAKMARYAFEFCALESCGKCTPCRIGSTRGVEVMDRLLAASNKTRELNLLNDLCDTMTHGSLCALGGLTPLPVQSAVKHFPEDFGLAAPAALAQSA